MVNELRDILYSILTSDDADNNGVSQSITQQLGVAVSNAMRKEKSINVIQVQAVVNQKIINKVIDALKLLDSGPELIQAEDEVKLIDVQPEYIEEEKPKYESTIVDLIDDSLDKKVTLNDFKESIGERYAAEAINQYGPEEARKILRLKPKTIKLMMQNKRVARYLE